jgi:5,10-methylenetetrahydromethanopterin reductase
MDSEISCVLTPSSGVVELAVLAEELGFARVWVNNSPAAHRDDWMMLGLIATRTERIGLGPAVLIPGLRHVMVTASALATLETLAPGRVAAVVGTGFASRMALGQRPATWAEVESYVSQLAALLRGESVEVDGALTKMLHPEGFLSPAPIAAPVLVAAMGPKGLEVAERLGTGVMSAKVPQSGFGWSVVTINGTVLDDGEELTAPRVIEAAGPPVAMGYHLAYELRGRAAVAALPRGAEWAAGIDEIPPAVRHLEMHGEHYTVLSPWDRKFVGPESIRALTMTGGAHEIGARLDDLHSGGATEIAYHPAGPDPRRELEAFARAVGLNRSPRA